MSFESSFKNYLRKHFSKTTDPTRNQLRKSLFYTLLAKASQFRPRLCFAAAKALDQNPKTILPWAIAIEMIHCASLIHDDLPVMDNAKTRRGKKCSHLIFGEDIALLAGTCLFIESFSLLSDPLFDKKRTEILNLLISKIGFKGLMSGQALDLKGVGSSKQKFFKMIQLKNRIPNRGFCAWPPSLMGQVRERKKSFKQLLQTFGAGVSNS